MQTVPHIEDMPAVFGLYESRTQLEQAIVELRTAGVKSAHISTLFIYNAQSGASNVGMTIGGTLGWLHNIGVIALPGAGPFIAGGPLMSALTGIGSSGTRSGISGTLIDLGVQDDDARLFDYSVREGNFLIAVHCEDRESLHRTMTILENSRAFDLSSTESHVGDVSPEKPGRALRL